MAEALLKGPKAASDLDGLLSRVTPLPATTRPAAAQVHSSPNGAESRPVGAKPAVAAEAAAPPAPVAATVEAETALSMEAYIESERCTTCNECTNLNAKLFAYNGEKQATVKDVRAGTFQQLVLAAERCPVGIIHPGTPLNPKEKDLEKWIKRAAPFS